MRVLFLLGFLFFALLHFIDARALISHFDASGTGLIAIGRRAPPARAAPHQAGGKRPSKQDPPKQGPPAAPKHPTGPKAPKKPEAPEAPVTPPDVNSKPDPPNAPATAAQRKIYETDFTPALRLLDDKPTEEKLEWVRDPQDPSDYVPWYQRSPAERKDMVHNAITKGEQMAADQKQSHASGKSRLSDEEKEVRRKAYIETYTTEPMGSSEEDAGDEARLEQISVDQSSFIAAGIRGLAKIARFIEVNVRPKVAGRRSLTKGRVLLRINAKEGLISREGFIGRTGKKEILHVSDLMQFGIVEQPSSGLAGVLESTKAWKAELVSNEVTKGIFTAALQDNAGIVDQDSLRVKTMNRADGETTVITGRAIIREGDKMFNAMTYTPNLRIQVQRDIDYGTGTDRARPVAYYVDFEIARPVVPGKFPAQLSIPSLVSIWSKGAALHDTPRAKKRRRVHEAFTG